MPQTLSQDLRNRLIAAVAGGSSCRAAAARFGIAPPTAIKWVKRWRQSGSLEAKRRGGDRKSSPLETHAEDILALVREKPDITLREIVEYLEERHGLKTAPGTVWRLLNRHRMTFKINGARPRTATA